MYFFQFKLKTRAYNEYSKYLVDKNISVWKSVILVRAVTDLLWLR